MSITIYQANKLKFFDYGWLKTRHHFSFGTYLDPTRMNFGALRVINDDEVLPGTGFAMHGHKNMEIITYVQKGCLTHRDNLHNIGTIAEGNLQIMSAGSGIQHSEHNESSTPLHFFQIWILPNKLDITPNWRTISIANSSANSTLPLLASGMHEHAKLGTLFIQQDAAIYGGKLQAEALVDLTIKHQAYVLVSTGTINLNKVTMHARDGAEVRGIASIQIEALTDTTMLVIDVPEI